MPKIWKLEDAKAHFSQLVDEALQGEPQAVTRRGRAVVVVLSSAQYQRLAGEQPSGLHSFRDAPTVEDFDPPRAGGNGRDPAW